MKTMTTVASEAEFCHFGHLGTHISTVISRSKKSLWDTLRLIQNDSRQKKDRYMTLYGFFWLVYRSYNKSFI